MKFITNKLPFTKPKFLFFKKSPNENGGEGESEPEQYRAMAIAKAKVIMASISDFEEPSEDLELFLKEIDINYQPEEGEVGAIMMIVYILKFNEKELREHVISAYEFYKDSFNDWRFSMHLLMYLNTISLNKRANDILDQ